MKGFATSIDLQSVSFEAKLMSGRLSAKKANHDDVLL